MNKCIVCGRKKIIETEGRYIKGDWIEDNKINKKYINKWICCWNCYSKLLQIKKK